MDPLTIAMGHMTRAFIDLKMEAEQEANPVDLLILHQECRYWGCAVSFLLAAGVNKNRHVYN